MAEQTPAGFTDMTNAGIRAAANDQEDEMDRKLSEASVTGNPPVPNSPSSQTGPGARQLNTAGGPNPSILAALAGVGLLYTPKFTKPPNLRKVGVNDWESCSNCVFFNKGCTLYGIERPPAKLTQGGSYPVDRDDLCDDYRTLTEPEDRTFGQMVTVVDRLSEALEAGDTAGIVRAQARFALLESRLDVEEMWSPAARAAALLAGRRRSRRGTRSMSTRRSPGRGQPTDAPGLARSRHRPAQHRGSFPASREATGGDG